MKKTIISFLVLGLMIILFLCNSQVKAETNYDGKLIKMDGLSTLYYVMDGKRYVFPNEKIYNSWFSNFNDVITLSQEEIYSLPLAGNVKYRPGVLLVKIQTNPKVYAISNNGQLRWVKTEVLAKKLYGDNWSQIVDDVPDSFFTDYKEITAIENESDYNAANEINNNDTIEKNNGLHLGQLKQKLSTTAKCRAIPATPAVPAKKSQTGKKIPAVPATPASRICKIEQPDEKDTQAPIISNVSVSALYNSANVNWTTNELADSAVIYSNDNFTNSTTTNSGYATTSHSIIINNLAASTTYQYYVKSVDRSGNIATSSKSSFITPSKPDTQVPVISSWSVSAISSTTATVNWITDELANSAVIFSSNNYISSTTVSSANFVTSHSIILNSLTASTTYQYYIISVDSSSNSATSNKYSFLTLAE